MKITLAELAELTDSRLEGDGNYVVEGAASVEDAGPADVAFLENQKYCAKAAASAAGALFLKEEDAAAVVGGPKNRLYTESPKWGYARVLEKIYNEKWPKEAVEISPKADIHHEARFGPGVTVGPFTVIKRRTLIGDRTRVSAQCYIGYNVRIGKDCVIHPQVVINDFCQIGDRTVIHSGTVIGGEGYGYAVDTKTGCHRKVHQVGRVVIEEDVEIGSNATIDRAVTGETVIGSGTKIDNLVQIGHNCRLGKNNLLVSQVGLAGSTTTGNQVTLAGQAGVAGHLTIGDGAIITAQTGVMGDVAPRAILFGSPARPHREAMKLQAVLSKLPDMYSFFKKAKAMLAKEDAHA
jgi:UDP-3-O-[3-hydroxymyristoyl] glucosamine N-acyltransferase